MGKSKVTLLFHTVRYLRLKQVYYRFYYALKNRCFSTQIDKTEHFISHQLRWNMDIPTSISFTDKVFTFLNLQQKFEQIDWNYDNYGKLWTYNLNYFDYLNQEEISTEQGVALIYEYIGQQANLKDGLEPYPTSLRIINWIKFISKHQIKDDKIDAVLFNHLTQLTKNLEYHLLGNHLLENAFALLFGAYYFQEERIYITAKKILKEELEEQVLVDGAHFELSPMYHQIILGRLLDCINLLSNNSWKKDELIAYLLHKAEEMLSWLKQITYKNGEVPQVNDTAYNIAPTSMELYAYADRLKLNIPNRNLSESGYRKWNIGDMEVLMDVGSIGPDYIPGHAHADTFSFELYYKGKPLIIDPGVSTYEKNTKRQLERSTEFHNTIRVDEKDSSEVWGGFRVARRAKVISLEENVNRMKATHDGYKRIGAYHTRNYNKSKANFIIEDAIKSKHNHQIESFLHFHPDCKVAVNGAFIEVGSELKIKVNNAKKILLEEYDCPLGFNKVRRAQKIRAFVEQHSKIEFILQ